MSSQVITVVKAGRRLQGATVARSHVLKAPMQAQICLPEIEEARQGCIRAVKVALAFQGGVVLAGYLLWQSFQWLR